MRFCSHCPFCLYFGHGVICELGWFAVQGSVVGGLLVVALMVCCCVCCRVGRNVNNINNLEVRGELRGKLWASRPLSPSLDLSVHCMQCEGCSCSSSLCALVLSAHMLLRTAQPNAAGSDIGQRTADGSISKQRFRPTRFVSATHRCTPAYMNTDAHKPTHVFACRHYQSQGMQDRSVNCPRHHLQPPLLL